MSREEDDALIEALLKMAKTIASGLESLSEDAAQIILSKERHGDLIRPYQVTLIGADGTIFGWIRKDIDGQSTSLTTDEGPMAIFNVLFPVTVRVEDDKGRIYEWSRDRPIPN